MKKKLILDVDGVKRNVISPILSDYNKRFNENIQYSDITSFDFAPILNKLEDPYKFYFEDKAFEVFELSSAYEKNISHLVNTLSQKYYIHIVSDQKPSNEKYTVNWLNKQNIYFDDLTFTANKIDIESDLIIDDKPSTLIMFKEANKQAICYDQPWNSEVDVKRISTLEEFLSYE